MPDTQDGLLLAQAISDQNKKPTAEQAEQNNKEALRKMALEAIMGKLAKPRTAPTENVQQSGMTCDAILGTCTIVGAEAKPEPASAKPATTQPATVRPDAPPVKPIIKPAPPAKVDNTATTATTKPRGGG